jgi:IMP dehydrogenase
LSAYKFDLPLMAAPMDSVVSPTTAIAIGKAGGLGVLNLEGIWTRYEDAEKQLAIMAKLNSDEAIENAGNLRLSYSANIN